MGRTLYVVYNTCKNTKIKIKNSTSLEEKTHNKN